MIDNSALFKITYGLFVLTARENGVDNGCMINTVMQQTSNPLTISVTVNKANKTHDMIKSSGAFNVSALTVKTPFDVIKRFGMQSGNAVDKFEKFPNTMRTENGVFAITDFSNSVISAKVVKTVDLGTHTWFLAEVTETDVFSAVESLTYGYYQSNVKPKPAAAPKGKVVWRCKICGYVYENDPLPADFICPICKHGASDFEKVE